ncbi:glycosyltransferase family 4 protein [Empedobacter brevis]|uniref:Glycosyltransferase family 4 protein n=1 Tax=Empedobacter brevis TaxID=247 RepID=A0AAJ1V844_9FLAO|nr:glycosyltransferase family 4 protein [Empedobacter brevis]MDM1073146.1 glycosyltransferase family 4 protein [Empedobacter brevis]QES91545.1 glycosyltransferase family 4 protein [Empedobacter brevis]
MKKILIITYYWPPAGGPGVQRWLKFTKYLPEFGYETYVYIPENPSYPILDDTLAKDVNPKVKLIKNKIWEPYQLAEKLNPKNKAYKGGHFEKKENQSLLSKLSVFVRGNFFIPDARKFWVNPSAEYLKDFLQKENIDTIVTSGPPHSLHLIGLKLKKQLPNIKWLADFRDPWTQISYHKELKLTSWAAKKHENLEREVMQKADVILATSYADGENFKKIGANSVEVITNGFEEVKQQTEKDQKYFHLTYSGGLEILRNPTSLWKALSEIIAENQSFKEDFKLDFYGSLADDVKQTIIDQGLENNLIVHGYVSHQESLNAINAANILLLTNFDNQASKGIIPGKLFEYMATGNPILAIGPTDADVEKILQKTEAGNYFMPQQVEEMKGFILSVYKQWLVNPNQKFETNEKEVQQFNRKNLTKKLVKVVDKL